MKPLPRSAAELQRNHCKSNSAGGIRTHDLGLLKHVVPPAFVTLKRSRWIRPSVTLHSAISLGGDKRWRELHPARQVDRVGFEPTCDLSSQPAFARRYLFVHSPAGLADKVVGDETQHRNM